jgi:hypothetical protein
MTVIQHVHDDGGRAAAGFRGDTGDCVTRAAAIASGRPYTEVYALVNELAQRERPRDRRSRSGARTGVFKQTTRRVMAALGGQWTPTMEVGSGCRVHLRADELPAGRIVVSLSHHVAAVVDGVLHDTHDCSREGTRCVYGYWTFPNGEVRKRAGRC